MVLCNICGWMGEDDDLIRKSVGLGDAPWGAGESIIFEWYCPECGEMDFDDGVLCPKCDNFIPEGKACDCEDE